MKTRSTSRHRPGSPSRADSSAPGSSRSVYRTQARRQSKQRCSHFDSHKHTPEATHLDSLLRRQGLAEAQQGNLDGAIALFSQLIDRNPANATDYNNRGLVYFQNGQHPEAIADYNTALRLNPNSGSIYNNRANYYAAQGRLLDAILDYNTAIELDPSNIRAWINQGITFRDLEMYDRAIECFDLALTLHRLEGHVYAERGRTCHLQGDWNYAHADYLRAIERLPLTLEARSNPSVRLRLQVELWLDDLLSPTAF